MTGNLSNDPFASEGVSVVLPVRNGGHYLRECIHSILAQTYPHFNIVVLDNASTDDTVAWLQGLQDPRIIIHPSSTFFSIEQNWGRIITVPRKKWMIITGHDDVFHPKYLEVMLGFTARHPGASLYQSHFSFIDKNGKVLRKCRPMAEKHSAADYYRETFENGGGFLMRSEDYDAVGGIPMYPNLFFSDYVLWLKLSGLSYKANCQEDLFSYREHDSNTTATSADEKYYSAFELFVTYLESQKKTNSEFSDVVNSHSKAFLSVFCTGMSHRMLRTPIKKRNGFTVSQLVKRFKGYADRLIDNNTFNPSSIPGIFIAKIIDSNPVSRKLFLLFKKLFPKPVLKAKMKGNSQ